MIYEIKNIISSVLLAVDDTLKMKKDICEDKNASLIKNYVQLLRWRLLYLFFLLYLEQQSSTPTEVQPRNFAFSFFQSSLISSIFNFWKKLECPDIPWLNFDMSWATLDTSGVAWGCRGRHGPQAAVGRRRARPSPNQSKLKYFI